MREGERFEHVRDWAGKLPAASVRIAGNLHCGEHLVRPWNFQVSADTMKRALSLAAVLSAHALPVFDLMGADVSMDAARKVWRGIDRRRKPAFAARDCFQGLKGRASRDFQACGVSLSRLGLVAFGEIRSSWMISRPFVLHVGNGSVSHAPGALFSTCAVLGQIATRFRPSPAHFVRAVHVLCSPPRSGAHAVRRRTPRPGGVVRHFDYGVRTIFVGSNANSRWMSSGSSSNNSGSGSFASLQPKRM